MAGPAPKEWSQAHGKAQRQLTRDVRAVLQQAYNSINKDMNRLDRRSGVGAAVRKDQLSVVRSRIKDEIDRLTRQLGGVIQTNKIAVGGRAIDLTARIDMVLFDVAQARETAEALKRSMFEGLQRTIDLAVARMEGASHRPLSQKIYNTKVGLNGMVDRSINSALARGLTAKEFTSEMRKFFRPNTPGGTRYASLRLARTEINNAFHALSIQHAMDRPWVPGMKWRLSGSHPEGDECDELAVGGRRSDGVYTPGEVPEKPHPQCFCYITPEPVSAERFASMLRSGAFDSYLERAI